MAGASARSRPIISPCTARPLSSNSMSRRSGRPMPGPTASIPIRAAKPGMSPSTPGCGCGKAPRHGSIRRSIKALGSPAPSASRALPAAKPIRSAHPSRTRASPGCSCARPSTLAEKPRRSRPTPTSSAALRRRTGWCSRSANSASGMSSTPTNTRMIRAAISSIGRSPTPARSITPPMPGPIPMALPRSGTKGTGPCAAASSICRWRRTQANSIRAYLGNSSGSANWSIATNCGASPARLAVTGFLTRGRMGRFADATALANLTGQPADIAAVRQYQSRPGVSVNGEQQLL